MKFIFLHYFKIKLLISTHTLSMSCRINQKKCPNPKWVMFHLKTILTWTAAESSDGLWCLFNVTEPVGCICSNEKIYSHIEDKWRVKLNVHRLQTCRTNICSAAVCNGDEDTETHISVKNINHLFVAAVTLMLPKTRCQHEGSEVTSLAGTEVDCIKPAN